MLFWSMFTMLIDDERWVHPNRFHVIKFVFQTWPYRGGVFREPWCGCGQHTHWCEEQDIFAPALHQASSCHVRARNRPWAPGANSSRAQCRAGCYDAEPRCGRTRQNICTAEVISHCLCVCVWLCLCLFLSVSVSVSVCVCMSVPVSMSVSVSVPVSVPVSGPMSVYICLCLYLYLCVCLCLCLCLFLCTWLCLCLYLCLRLSMCAGVYVCVCMRAHVCVCARMCVCEFAFVWVFVALLPLLLHLFHFLEMRGSEQSQNSISCVQ